MRGCSRPVQQLACAISVNDVQCMCKLTLTDPALQGGQWYRLCLMLAGKSLSSLKGLESGILFCTYDLLTSGTSRGKKKTASGATQGRKGAGKNSAAARLIASENVQPWQLQQQQQQEPSPDAEEQHEFWAEEHDEEAAAEEFGE